MGAGSPTAVWNRVMLHLLLYWEALLSDRLTESRITALQTYLLNDPKFANIGLDVKHNMWRDVEAHIRNPDTVFI